MENEVQENDLEKLVYLDTDQKDINDDDNES
jgi:hypothetical protein